MQRRGGYIGVRLLAVIVGEVIECLEGGCGIGVEGDELFTCRV